MRILLIEDHERLADLIREGLSNHGFAVDHCGNGAAALEVAEAVHYDAIVLDLGLPDMDGLEVLRTMRSNGLMTPVLVLTSRVQVPNRVEGLDAGADDYMTKPFSMDELSARLRALLRRPSETLGLILSLGNLSLDTASREARVDDRLVALTARETETLELLLRRGGKVVPRQLIEDLLSGLDGVMSPNSMEVQVHRLRKKLEAANADVLIHAVRGVGYMLMER